MPVPSPQARHVYQSDHHNSFVAHGIVPGPYGHPTLFERRAQVVHVDSDVVDSVPDRIAAAVEALEGIGFQLEVGRTTAEDILYDRPLPDLIPNPYEVTHYRPSAVGCAPPPPAAKPPGAIGRLLGAKTMAPPPQRILACHWQDARVAVVGKLGKAVYILDTQLRDAAHIPLADMHLFVVREDPRVEDIRAISWRPYAPNTLAAACSDGIALWEGGGSGAVRQGVSTLRILQAPGHTHIVALSWSADGARLMSTSATDGTCRLWDVATGVSSVLCPGAALAAAYHAPDLVAVAAPRAPAFRLCRLDGAAHERWGALCGPPAALAWCRRAPLLVVAPRGEAALHFLSVQDGREAELIHTEATALPKIGPGGTATSIAWDNTGERLAVAFEDLNAERAPFAGTWDEDPDRRFAVAVYTTALQPVFSLSPLGYVSGPQGSGPPLDVQFRKKTGGKSSAVLVVAWKSGAVSFTHHLFKAAN